MLSTLLQEVTDPTEVHVSEEFSLLSAQDCANSLAGMTELPAQQIRDESETIEAPDGGEDQIPQQVRKSE